MTELTVKKLEEAFLMGCTDVEACLFADISKQTLYNYQAENPSFIDRKAQLKTNPVMKARKVLLDAIDGQKDAKVAQWMVEKQDGKARQSLELSGSLAISHEDALKELE
jgi:hypothetical protein